MTLSDSARLMHNARAMNLPRRASFFFLAVSTAGLAGCAVSVDMDPSVSHDSEEAGEYIPLSPEQKADGVSFPSTPLTFGEACEPGDRLIITAVGDVLLHGSLQRQAYASSKGAVSLWEDALPALRAGDLTYANFEGASAEGVTSSGRLVTDPGKRFDDSVYTSYPQFNYHGSVIDALIESGVDIVSTANNHAMDRRSVGVDRTIDALTQRGLAFTGTRKSDATSRDFGVVMEAKGFRTAWIACTFSTNGLPDTKRQVFMCYQDKPELLSLIREYSQRPDIDAVIVTPHWGLEYEGNPQRQEVSLGHELIEAGALAVIGSHPHVTEPWEKYTASDGREGFVLYSLGNFVSNQNSSATRSGLVLTLELLRTSDGQTRVAGVRYLPTYMQKGSSLSLDVLDFRDALSGEKAASHRLTRGMFGAYNQAHPEEALDGTPQCDPNWSAPRSRPAFVGEPCTQTNECDFEPGAYCHSAGFCTVECVGFCDDREGYAGTFCADVNGEGICLSKSSSANAYCAGVPGTVAATTARYVGASPARDATATTCVPAAPQ